MCQENRSATDQQRKECDGMDPMSRPNHRGMSMMLVFDHDSILPGS
jgi:hypothetical protein